MLPHKAKTLSQNLETLNILAVLLTFALIYAVCALPSLSFGQISGDQETLEELTVVGSRTIARSSLETISPVDNLSRQDLEATAHIETGRAIQKLTPSFNFPSTSIADGTDSLKPATLRGLGPDQTLVLVDGLRRHKSALLHVNSSVGRGTAGTDMNALAPSFIEKIEVLRDGASTQYGSDAIAGVINVRLKTGKDNKSAVFGTYSRTVENDGVARHIALNKGIAFPNGATLFLGYEHNNKDKTNRSGLSGSILFSAPAGTTDPATCNANSNAGCDARERSFNRKNFVVGDPETNQHIAMINVRLPVHDSWVIKHFAIASKRNNQSTGFYREPDDTNRNVVELYPNGFLPAINTDIEDASAVFGLSGMMGDWQTDIAYSYGRNRFDFFISNSLNASFGASSPRQADSGGLSYKHRIINLDFVRTFSDISFAFGGEWKDENYAIRAGEPLSYVRCQEENAKAETRLSSATCEDKAGGIQVFPGFRPTNVLEESRKSFAVYAEASKEVGQWLTNLAVRFEDYDEIGNSFTGKLGLRYELTQTHSLRATFGTGFRAPSIHQIYFNNVSTQFVSDGAGGTTAQETGTFRNDSGIAKALGVQTLKEEESSSIGLGYVFTPRKNFSLTVDGYHIDIDDRIILSGAVKNSNTDLSQDALDILREEGVTSAQFFMNAPTTQTQGLDIIALWKPVLSKHDLSFKLSANFTKTEVKGEFNPPQLLAHIKEALFSRRDRSIIEDWQPKHRVALEGKYEVRQLTFFGVISHYGRYKSSEGSGDNYVEQAFSSASVVDIRISWQTENHGRLTLFGDNIFDSYPEENITDRARAGTIKNIVESPNGVFRYSRRTAPYGFTGAVWGLKWHQPF